jgi:hypothetical protein
LGFFVELALIWIRCIFHDGQIIERSAALADMR